MAAIVSQEASANNEQGLNSLMKYFQARPGLYTTEQVQGIYELVKRQQHGDEILSLVEKMTAEFGPKQAEVARPYTILAIGTGAFKASTSAQSSSINLWWYSRIDVSIQHLNGVKRAVTNAGGICMALPGGVAWGTFYYNDVSDLHGNDITTQVGGYLGYWEITYWRNNSCFATYQAGGFPGGPCAMGGTTTFS